MAQTGEPSKKGPWQGELTAPPQTERKELPGKGTGKTSPAMPMKKMRPGGQHKPPNLLAPIFGHSNPVNSYDFEPTSHPPHVKTQSAVLIGQFQADSSSQPCPLQLFYSVQAGFPSPAEDFDDRRLDLNEFLIRNPPATFLLRVVGESMTGIGIFDGDFIIVDRSLQPLDGDIVVACLDNAFTVKRLRRLPDRVVLQAENPSVSPIEILGDQQLELFGVVTNCVRRIRK